MQSLIHLDTLEAQAAHMDGLPTWTAIPNVGMRHLDPFLLINHHGPVNFPPNNNGLPFGPHPHKGFETLTYILEGELVHRDSTGLSSNILSGGVQWMTAGKGIVHAEESSDSFKQSGGNLEIIQLWFNLPPDLKLSAPNYQGFQRHELPEVPVQNGTFTLVAGTYLGTTGPASSLTNMFTGALRLNKGQATFQVPSGRQVMFYVVRGEGRVNGVPFDTRNLLTFNLEGGEMVVSTLENCLILIAHGAPTNAPIASYGPFVMNSPQELIEAMQEYQEGKMGSLTN
jgi:hypothetical protein